jgi:hypothetical protein
MRRRSIIQLSNSQGAVVMRLKKILLFGLGIVAVLSALFAVRKLRK